jgi:hypothetical protein
MEWSRAETTGTLGVIKFMLAWYGMGYFGAFQNPYVQLEFSYKYVML